MANAAAYGHDAWRDTPPAGDAGDDADWEYEYSTTETETHLITLDLSLPEFLRRRKEHIMHNTRGGFRSWMNPIMNNDDASPPPPARAPDVQRPPRAGGLAEDDDPEDEQEGGDREENGRRAGRGNDDGDNDDDHDGTREDRLVHEDKPGGDTDALGDGDGDDTIASEIQILDLHSAQPLFAYRGVVLTGAWTEVIGTELVFAEGGGGPNSGSGGDGDDPIEVDADAAPPPPPPPVAAHAVAADVDLLGAATARIQCTPTELRPRATAAAAAAAATEDDGGAAAAKKRRVGFSIPVAANASAQRQKQAAFLEQLMAVKHRFGEHDVVTVQALETTQDAVPAGDDEEALRRAKRQVQAARDHRRVLARREREREQRDRRERQAQQMQHLQEVAGGAGGAGGAAGTRPGTEAEAEAMPDGQVPTRSPASRRKRGRTAVDGVAGDELDDGSTAAPDARRR